MNSCAGTKSTASAAQSYLPVFIGVAWAAHIFQPSVVTLVPKILLFFATAD
jgi:hypothetical protein